MSPEQVIALLGTPDDDHPSGPEDPWAAPKSRLFVYYVKRVDGTFRDQKIEIVFNPAPPQKVQNVLVMNIPELSGSIR